MASRTESDAEPDVLAALKRSQGRWATAATRQMADRTDWFDALSAEDRSWVGLILQAGIHGFIDWYAEECGVPTHHQATAASDQHSAPHSSGPVAAQVFGVAPRALTGRITLQQTVELVRVSTDVIEHHLDELIDDAITPEQTEALRMAVARYAREVAFATAEVYARAAEQRGAWDARLEALVADAVMRGEADDAMLSRASALGWRERGAVVAVVGAMPEDRNEHDIFDDVRRAARHADLDALCADQGGRLVVVLGGPLSSSTAVSDPALELCDPIVDAFGPGPIVVGPLVAELLQAHTSSGEAVAAYLAAAGWPGAPRPVTSHDLLPERVLAGDPAARRHVVEHVFVPLETAGEALVSTLAAYFDQGLNLEATAREVFVHVNTVRYRLRQVAELTGLDPTTARDARVLQMALTLGHMGRDG